MSGASYAADPGSNPGEGRFNRSFSRLMFGCYGCVGFENRYIRDDFAGLYVKNTCAVDAFVIDDHGCLGTVSGVHN